MIRKLPPLPSRGVPFPSTGLPFATLPALLLLVASACAGGGSDVAVELRAVVDTVGDTVIVRVSSGSRMGEGVLVPEVSVGTLDGPPETQFGRINAIAVGPDGTMHIMDGQVPVLRSYGRDGAYLRTVGRAGSGPGEYRQPDSGLAVLSDGRILVRDPGNGRMAVFSAEGEPLETWVLRGGLNTSRPLYVDREDRAWFMLLLDPSADVGDWRMGLLRLSPAGEPIDTLVAPTSDLQGAVVEARRENSVSQSSVPFTPRFAWAVTRSGDWLVGLSTSYQVEVRRQDGSVLRLIREMTPVPVLADEKRANEERITRNMRGMVPAWRWNGPPIPDVKPPFQSIHPASDGRIWVLLHGEGWRAEEARRDPQGEGMLPEVWRERVAFDVFEEDGTYLGTVRAPDGLASFPEPVFRGDTVWALTRDDLDVQQVVRYQVRWGAEEGEG